MCLLPFIDAHLKVDGVADNVDFRRLEIIEEVTVVPVGVAHSVLILRKAFVHVGLVVHVTFLHVEQAGQVIGRIDRIAHPGDVSDVILLALIHFDIDVDMLRVDVPYAVLQDGRITETIFVVLRDEFLLVFRPAFGSELLRLQEAGQFSGFMRLAECSLCEQRTLDFLVAQLIVAFDYYLVYLEFLLLVHVNIQDYLVLGSDIVTLTDIDFGILVAFLIKVLLGENPGPVDHVRRDLSALQQSELLLHVLSFRLLQAVVVDGGDAWPWCKMYLQIDVVAHDGVCRDGNVGEESMLPVAFHGIRDSRPRYLQLLSDAEPGYACKDIILIALDTGNGQSCEFVGLRRTGISDVWVYDFLLCACRKCYSGEGKEQQHLIYIRHLSRNLFVFVFFYLFLCLSEPSLPALEARDGFLQVVFAEVGPVGITEVKF